MIRVKFYKNTKINKIPITLNFLINFYSIVSSNNLKKNRKTNFKKLAFTFILGYYKLYNITIFSITF